MLPPNNMTIRQLSKEEEISEGTLHAWRSHARAKGQLLPVATLGLKVGFRATSSQLCWKRRR
jgi:transposase-like protein